MISQQLLYSIVGILMFGIGLHGIIVTADIIRKIMSLNVIGIGIFMIFIATSYGPAKRFDPVPHALVLTGIVVAIAGTALALSIFLRIHNLKQQNIITKD